MTQRFQAILFDLDGTLIDTEPTAARAIATCFERWGMQVEPSDASYITGRTWASAVEYLFGKYEFPVARDEAEQAMVGTYRAELERELIVVPGAPEAVRLLAGEFQLGLVSGSGRSEILWALDRLRIREHFSVILGAEDYPRSKPEPDGYAKAMSTLGVTPPSVLIFEDSSAGIRSARAAGGWVIAVTSTNHFGQELGLAHDRVPDLRCITSHWIAGLAKRLFLESGKS
jgi:HAD superfamily hydrolase (TIGR01509 family)